MVLFLYIFRNLYPDISFHKEVFNSRRHYATPRQLHNQKVQNNVLLYLFANIFMF